MATKSNPLSVTHKSVFTIAVPMGLGYLTTPLVGIADTAIVGQLGEAALIGGVAVAAAFIGILLTTFNFLRFATSALTAQAIGRKDGEEVVGVLLRSCLIGIVAGLIVIACSTLILKYGLIIMSPSDAVAEAVRDYFNVRILATPFSLLNFVFFAWFVGTDRPILSFLTQSFLNVLNIALTYYFVLVKGMGVEGAAWGTVVAEAVTVFVSLFFAVKPVSKFAGQLLAMTFNARKLTTMMVLNGDIMVRSFCLHIAFVFFTRQSAQQSDNILAANEILLHFFMIAGYFLDGFAVAAEQFIGRAIGAKDRNTFKRAVHLTSFWNVVQAVLLSLVFIAFGSAIVAFMTPNEEIRAIAATYIIWAVITPVVGVAAFQMDGIFIGATWSRDMRNTMIWSLVLMIVTYYILFPILDNHGLWLALNIFLGLRGLLLYLRLKSREDATFSAS
ncbi:MAG: MATE family efflux transporter [Hyphomicrobiales bacterium]